MRALFGSVPFAYTLALFLLLPASARATGACYDPMREPEMLTIYGEAFLHQIKPLLREAHTQLGVDPRIIFHRMVGEARGNPDIENPSSKAYGIFQVLGAFYKKDPHRDRIEAMYPENSTYRERQYVQVKYYVKHYLPEAIAAVHLPYAKCFTEGANSWSAISWKRKVTFLGWGDCRESYLEAEQHILDGGVASYKPQIIQSIDDLALCEGWGSSSIVAEAEVPPLIPANRGSARGSARGAETAARRPAGPQQQINTQRFIYNDPANDFVLADLAGATDAAAAEAGEVDSAVEPDRDEDYELVFGKQFEVLVLDEIGRTTGETRTITVNPNRDTRLLVTGKRGDMVRLRIRQNGRDLGTEFLLANAAFDAIVGANTAYQVNEALAVINESGERMRLACPYQGYREI